MKKIILILMALSLVLAGCGKVHDPSSTTQDTEPSYQEAITTETNYNMEASLINNKQMDGKYIYTLFVGANDAYATLSHECVYYLTDTYQKINEVFEDVDVQVLNVNKTSTNDTAAFIYIVSPQILDLQKLFVYAIGTTQYEEGMTFESTEDYCEKYPENTLVSVYLQVTQRTFDMDTLYTTKRPVYESIRLVNLGSGYDVIVISTETTKSYIENETLWTPVNITTFATTDYSTMFADILNDAYVAYGNKSGSYQDIILEHNSQHTVDIRLKEGTVEVGITNYIEEENAPNCIVGNVVVSEGVTTISNDEGQRAIILFFN